MRFVCFWEGRGSKWQQAVMRCQNVPTWCKVIPAYIQLRVKVVPGDRKLWAQIVLQAVLICESSCPPFIQESISSSVLCCSLTRSSCSRPFYVQRRRCFQCTEPLLLLPGPDISAHRYPLNLFSFYLPPAVLVPAIVGLHRRLSKNLRHPWWSQ